VRALISLYHRSASFINYDNLSERIDEQFTDPNNSPTVAVRNFNYVNLTQQLAKSRENAGRQSPIFGNIDQDFSTRAWSDQQRYQDETISGALWGVEYGRPGLEIILETNALNEKEQSLLEATATGKDEKQIETSNNTDINKRVHDMNYHKRPSGQKRR